MRGKFLGAESHISFYDRWFLKGNIAFKRTALWVRREGRIREVLSAHTDYRQSL